MTLQEQAAPPLLAENQALVRLRPSRGWVSLRLGEVWKYRELLYFRDGLLLCLAVVVTGTAIGLTRLPVAPTDVAGYTLLWMIPADTGNSTEYRLGITSAEFAETRYHLQVSAGNRVAQDWPELRLKPGEAWETTIGLQNDQVVSGSIVAELYRLDNPTMVYRHVMLRRGD